MDHPSNNVRWSRSHHERKKSTYVGHAGEIRFIKLVTWCTSAFDQRLRIIGRNPPITCLPVPKSPKAGVKQGSGSLETMIPLATTLMFRKCTDYSMYSAASGRRRVLRYAPASGIIMRKSDQVASVLLFILAQQGIPG